MQIREERDADAHAISRVHDLAFGRRSEGEIVVALRAAGALTASLVAVDGGEIIGHVAFSPVEITGADGDLRALGLGPLGVLASQRRRGVGARLVNTSLVRLRRAGHHAVFVLGAPEYYRRFGFERASAHGLRWEHEAPDEAFLVLELTPGGLAGREGIVRHHPAFGGR